MVIIGVTGTNGAGKGTIVEYLLENKGFSHHSARAFITEEILRRGLPVNRDNTNLVANDLRRTHHPAYIIEELHRRAILAGDDAVIESIRTIGEAEFLKSKGALIWAVDAPREVRYERNILRGTDLDKITFEKFCEQEDREMDQKEKFDMNIKGIIAMADKVFINNTTKEELHEQIRIALEGIK